MSQTKIVLLNFELVFHSRHLNRPHLHAALFILIVGKIPLIYVYCYQIKITIYNGFTLVELRNMLRFFFPSQKSNISG